jgi:hypothetical protein
MKLAQLLATLVLTHGTLFAADPAFITVPQFFTVLPVGLVLKQGKHWQANAASVANQAFAAKALNQPARLQLAFTKVGAASNNGYGYNIPAIVDAPALTVNGVAVKGQVYVYFRPDQAAALTKLPVPRTFTVEGLVKRCDFTDNGATFTLDLCSAEVMVDPAAAATARANLAKALVGTRWMLGRELRFDATRFYCPDDKPGEEHTWAVVGPNKIIMRWNEATAPFVTVNLTDGILTEHGCGYYTWKRWPLPPSKETVQVISARYGSDSRWWDVTAIVQAHLSAKKMIPASIATFGGDPAPWAAKKFDVYFIKGGKVREQHRADNEHVLWEGFYGPQDAGELAAWLPTVKWRRDPTEMPWSLNADGSVGTQPKKGTWKAKDASLIEINWGGTIVPTRVHWDYNELREEGGQRITFKRVAVPPVNTVPAVQAAGK